MEGGIRKGKREGAVKERGGREIQEGKQIDTKIDGSLKVMVQRYVQR